MATFIKRGHKYQVQIRRRGLPTACRSFHRKTDAEEWARHMESQADRGDMPAPLRTLAQHTVKGLLERYQREVSIKKRGYNTERYVLERMARQPFAALSLAALTSAKLAEYRDQRLKTVQPGTIRRDLSILKIVLDTASREWGLPLRENPVTRLPRIRPQSGRTRRLRTDELKQLEIAASGLRNTNVLPVMRFAIATGMRRGEILGMTWGHLNRDSRTLTIPFTKNGYW